MFWLSYGASVRENEQFLRQAVQIGIVASDLLKKGV